jgi:F-type H+-transporting ATPase subunit gamma
MPSLKAVRIRIASVKSTQKITSAMKLVAAAKLRRAQDAIVAARPYAQALSQAVSEIAARAGSEAHPMLQQRDGKRTALIVLTSDRGLAGAFNSGVSRAVVRYREEGQQNGSLEDLQLTVSGRKGVEYFKRRRIGVKTELPGATGDTAIDRAREIAQIATDAFMSGQVDRVLVAYNEFRSAVSQRVVIEPLLPIEPAPLPPEAAQLDFAYEPSREQLLDLLLPLYVQSRAYRAILESVASEFGAKMTAMENATRNAKEMIERLTLQYNRARQAAITKELMEIVSGAEALNG